MEDGYSGEQINYHVLLLAEAGLIEAENVTTFGDIDLRPTRLTWEGHEFLDASKDENMWNKAKGVVIDRTGGITFAVLKSVLIEMAK